MGPPNQPNDLALRRATRDVAARLNRPPLRLTEPHTRRSAPTLRLPAAFFERSVHDVARDLIGCTVAHGDTAGVIVETESYHADDPACHAFGGPTPRSSVLFGPPAHAYVYLSYGIHSLLNFVAEPEGEAAAVLIRALEPDQPASRRCARGAASSGSRTCAPGRGS